MTANKFKPFATIYGNVNNGHTHGCINYTANESRSGVFLIIDLKRQAKNMPIFDISKGVKIIGLNYYNAIQRGAKIIRF